MKFLLAAYAAAPPPQGDTLERFYRALRESHIVGGLEIPFYGDALSPFLVNSLAPTWRNVLTCLPGIMNLLLKEPAFGLASRDTTGRRQAVEFVGRARTAALALQEKHGPSSVEAVEIHSAPRQGPLGMPGDAESFAESLREIRSWDWKGISLWVEHCDAYREGQVPAKGFLSLEDECRAVSMSDGEGAARCQFAINWGRSAIEARDPEAPLGHLEVTKRAKLLAALIFSGCTASDPLYGEWADSHAPFGGSSLLTLERVRQCLKQAKGTDCRIGLKMQALPESLGVSERIMKVKGWLVELSRAAEME
jgi:hypothetical protein